MTKKAKKLALMHKITDVSGKIARYESILNTDYNLTVNCPYHECSPEAAKHAIAGLTRRLSNLYSELNRLTKS